MHLNKKYNINQIKAGFAALGCLAVIGMFFLKLILMAVASLVVWGLILLIGFDISYISVFASAILLRIIQKIFFPRKKD